MIGLMSKTSRLRTRSATLVTGFSLPIMSSGWVAGKLITEPRLATGSKTARPSSSASSMQRLEGHRVLADVVDDDHRPLGVDQHLGGGAQGGRIAALAAGRLEPVHRPGRSPSCRPAASPGRRRRSRGRPDPAARSSRSGSRGWSLSIAAGTELGWSSHLTKSRTALPWTSAVWIQSIHGRRFSVATGPGPAHDHDREPGRGRRRRSRCVACRRPTMSWTMATPSLPLALA